MESIAATPTQIAVPLLMSAFGSTRDLAPHVLRSLNIRRPASAISAEARAEGSKNVGYAGT